MDIFKKITGVVGDALVFAYQKAKGTDIQEIEPPVGAKSQFGGKQGAQPSAPIPSLALPATIAGISTTTILVGALAYYFFFRR